MPTGKNRTTGNSEIACRTCRTHVKIDAIDPKRTRLHAGVKSGRFRSGSEKSEAQIEAIGFHQQPNQHLGATEHRKLLENFELR
jgi:ribosome assembly protein YihI (activator of Der GTPase)